MLKNKIKKVLPAQKQPVENKLSKILIYVIVVNSGCSDPVLKLLKDCGSNVQFACMGRGTATKEVLNMLGLENRAKDIVLAFVDESNVLSVQKDLKKYFKNNKKVMGMGFTLPLTSIVGEKMYHFLTNTL